MSAGSPARRPESKIRDRAELALELERLRPATVVLANGLFDVVHVGHARYLADARSRGDLLVVALNDDGSATANKGAGRPLVPLESRLLVVAALAAVDFVTWFPERTLGETLRLLRPDLHAKGTDYRPETLPDDERIAHEELGIRVAIVGDPKDHATRDIIDEVRRRFARAGPERA